MSYQQFQPHNETLRPYPVVSAQKSTPPIEEQQPFGVISSQYERGISRLHYLFNDNSFETKKGMGQNSHSEKENIINQSQMAHPGQGKPISLEQRVPLQEVGEGQPCTSNIYNGNLQDELQQLTSEETQMFLKLVKLVKNQNMEGNSKTPPDQYLSPEIQKKVTIHTSQTSGNAKALSGELSQLEKSAFFYSQEAKSDTREPYSLIGYQLPHESSLVVPMQQNGSHIKNDDVNCFTAKNTNSTYYESCSRANTNSLKGGFPAALFITPPKVN